MIQEAQLRQIADDPKTWLTRNYKSEVRIKAKRDRIQHLYSVCYSVTQEIKSVTVYTGPTNKVENCVNEIVDLESEILDEIAALKQIQCETSEAIKTLLDDVTLITLMEMRYLSDKSWEEIAVDMNYAFRWIMRLHAKALKQMKQAAIKALAA